MAKISKVFYLVLIFSVLILGACKKSSKGRSIGGGGLTPPYPNGANYTLEVLPDDDMENLEEIFTTYLKSDAFPEFKGPKRVEFLNDAEVLIYFDPVSLSDFSEDYQSLDPNYLALARNDEGVYELRSTQPVVNTGGPNAPEDHILVQKLKPGQAQSVRLILAAATTPIEVDFNRHVINFRMPAVPPAPSSVTVSSGNKANTSVISAQKITSVHVIDTPYFWRDSALEVKIFSDSACTQEVGRRTLDIPSTYFHFKEVGIKIETPLALGEHRFYATFVNQLGKSSPCSTAYASYTVVDCPEDYVVIQPDQVLGTPAFCIMNTEARRGANDVAVPGYEEYPWQATPQDAKDACRRVGPNCDIITNLEWMATARQIDAHMKNWDSFSRVMMYCGSFYWYPEDVQNIEDNNISIGFPDRRTSYVPGGILYDFIGNLAEWADNAEVGGEVFQPITNTCPQGPFELLDPAFSCPELDPRYYTPYNRPGKAFDDPSIPYIHDNYFIGKIVGPAPADRNSATPIAAARGGAGYIENSGPYSLFMFNHMTDTNGFRCVCHLGGT